MTSFCVVHRCPVLRFQLTRICRSAPRRTHDSQLVLAVEEHVLTAAVDRVDELERQPAAADDRNVR